MKRLLFFLLILPVYVFANHGEYTVDATPPPAPQRPQAAPRRYHMFPQQGNNTCWACAIKNMLAQYGVQKKESDVVRVGMGGLYDIPINNYGMAKVLKYYKMPGKYYGRLNKQALKSVLEKKYGVFVFVPGHVMVAQDVDSQGKIMISDPAGGRTKKVTYEQLVRNAGYYQTLIIPKPRTHQFEKGFVCAKVW